MTVTVLAIVVVVAALAFGAYGLTKAPATETSYAASTTTYTTTIYKNVQMTGTCTAVSYFIPDTMAVSITNVTVTSGTSTSYYQSSVTLSGGETTLGTTTYSTSTYGNGTTVYTTTSTSQNLNDIPSNGWTVTTCTFSP